MHKCNGCTTRSVGCHSKCYSYIAYKKDREIIYAERKESVEARGTHRDSITRHLKSGKRIRN